MSGARRYKHKVTGEVVYAIQWEGATTYQKGKHYLYPMDWFFGSSPDITPYQSRFMRKADFELAYELIVEDVA